MARPSDPSNVGPPGDPVRALAWAREAIAAKRYVVATHFGQRLIERGLVFDDALHAITRATRCEPYPSQSEHGGSSWRVTGTSRLGTSPKGTELSIGLETFLDDTGRSLVLITIFQPKTRRGRR